jgi:ABC-2 type transport system permease protein
MTKVSGGSVSTTIGQSAHFAVRNLRRMRRNPATVVGAVVSPVVFLLGFDLVLGRTLEADGVEYGQYLPPAIAVQSTLNVAIGSAFWLADDVATGMLSRARSMPIARVAPLLGRVFADLTRSILSTVVVLAVGTLLGFRFSGGAAAFVAFWLLVTLFSAASAAGFGLIALRSRNPEAAANLLTLPFLPLVFLSTAYVPAERFPAALEGVVAAQPVSVVIDALRGLANGNGPGSALPALLWCAGLLLVFLLLAERAVRRRA